MDYQTTQGMPGATPSKKGLYVTVGIVLVIIAIAYWYLSATPQAPILSGGNLTADIQNDLNQSADASAALNSDNNTVNSNIQAL